MISCRTSLNVLLGISYLLITCGHYRFQNIPDKITVSQCHHVQLSSPPCQQLLRHKVLIYHHHHRHHLCHITD